MAKTAFHDPELGDLTDDHITRDYWVFQRKKGHRYSSDDLSTAYVASLAAPEARLLLDLGCGLGSVLLFMAWKIPEARVFGIEAQSISYALLRRNVERNGLRERVETFHGDLRDQAIVEQVGAFPEVSTNGGFDLITGTPPYFPPGHAEDALDEQRAYARIEYRGGVEAYIETAARLLSPKGTFVVCGAAASEGRVQKSAAEHAFFVVGRCDIIAREGRPALFSIWTLRRTPEPLQVTFLTLRDADGNTTEDAATLKRFSGLIP